MLLRKLPKDEWDVNFENLSGANISERVEDGTQVLRENQAESKFQALSKKTRLSAEEADKAAIGVEESDEDKQEDSDHQPAAPIDCEQESSSAEDDLQWTASCMLDDDLVQAPTKPTKQKGTSSKPPPPPKQQPPPKQAARTRVLPARRSPSPTRSAATADEVSP